MKLFWPFLWMVCGTFPGPWGVAPWGGRVRLIMLGPGVTASMREPGWGDPGPLPLLRNSNNEMEAFQDFCLRQAWTMYYVLLTTDLVTTNKKPLFGNYLTSNRHHHMPNATNPPFNDHLAVKWKHSLINNNEQELSLFDSSDLVLLVTVDATVLDPYSTKEM